jgi:hypothetical protein
MTSRGLWDMDASGDYFISPDGLCNREKRKREEPLDIAEEVKEEQEQVESSEQVITTNNFNDIINATENNIYHVLISKRYRQEISLDLKFMSNLNDDQIISTVSNNLQESDETVLFYIAGFDKVDTRMEKDQNNNEIYFSKCVFVIFCIPKNLISKLMENNMNKCYFYIGNYMDGEKFMIMNKTPNFDDISNKSSIGVIVPYQTSLLTFERQ